MEIAGTKPPVMFVFITPLLDRSPFRITDVRHEHKVKVVKEKVKARIGYEVARQRLYWHGRLMEDDCTFASQGIPETCRMTQMNLLIVPKGAVDIPVLIDFGDIRNIELPPRYTILELKERLRFLEGCPLFWFSLTYDGEETENTRTIESYGFPQNGGKFEFTTLTGPCEWEEAGALAMRRDIKRKLYEDYDKVEAIISKARRSDEKASNKETAVIPLPPP